MQFSKGYWNNRFSVEHVTWAGWTHRSLAVAPVDRTRLGRKSLDARSILTESEFGPDHKAPSREQTRQLSSHWFWVTCLIMFFSRRYRLTIKYCFERWYIRCRSSIRLAWKVAFLLYSLVSTLRRSFSSLISCRDKSETAITTLNDLWNANRTLQPKTCLQLYTTKTRICRYQCNTACGLPFNFWTPILRHCHGCGLYVNRT